MFIYIIYIYIYIYIYIEKNRSIVSNNKVNISKLKQIDLIEVNLYYCKNISY